MIVLLFRPFNDTTNTLSCIFYMSHCNDLLFKTQSGFACWVFRKWLNLSLWSLVILSFYLVKYVLTSCQCFLTSKTQGTVFFWTNLNFFMYRANSTITSIILFDCFIWSLSLYSIQICVLVSPKTKILLQFIN